MSFDGFCWMEGRNNQPKVRIIGILSWETARREDTVANFWQLDFEAKNKYNEIRRGFWRTPIDDGTQKPTKFTRGQWRRVRRGRSNGGERRGAVFDRSGGDQGGRGEKIIGV